VFLRDLYRNIVINSRQSNEFICTLQNSKCPSYGIFPRSDWPWWPADSVDVVLTHATARLIKLKLNDGDLTNTAGQIAVGGRMCCLNSPKSHSGLTCEAHLLCSCTSQSTRPHHYTTDVHAHVQFCLFAKLIATTLS